MNVRITEYDSKAAKRLKLLYIVPTLPALWIASVIVQGIKAVDMPWWEIKRAWCDEPECFRCSECKKTFLNRSRGKIYPFMCPDCETTEVCT